jgi:ABC-2 type transport system permease protein
VARRACFAARLRVVFTVVIPLAVMTTYPAEALLGRLSWQNAAIAMGMTVGLAVVSRLVWVRSLSRYTSAGG